MDIPSAISILVGLDIFLFRVIVMFYNKKKDFNKSFIFEHYPVNILETNQLLFYAGNHYC